LWWLSSTQSRQKIVLQVLRAFGIPQKKHLYFISVSVAFLGISLPPTPNWSRFDLFLDVYSISFFIVFLATDFAARPFGKEEARKHAAKFAGTKLIFSIFTPLPLKKCFIPQNNIIFAHFM
jgi:hypothetical protein